MASRNAIDCLRRGFHSTRANWGLIPMKFLGDFLFAVLLVVSFLPPILVLGGMAFLDGGWSEAAIEEWIVGLPDRLLTSVGPLVLAVLGSLVLGLLAVVVWGWFEGGLLGVLVAAERQAHPRAQDQPGGWRWFRTFTLRDFSGWGGRYVWRFFWFFHLALTVSLIFVLLLALLVVAVVFGQERWGAGAAVGIGCGGLLPLLFLVLVYALWYTAAQPAVALEGSGPVRGSKLALRVVGRRLGASFLILLVIVVISMVVGMGFFLAQTASSLTLQEEYFVPWLVTYGLLYLFQMAASSALSVYFLAAFGSLVVAETAEAPR
ncbi:MAG TPA: hypothetical protein VLF66_16680 [Thermoanaerobaculia bacterium]|nr:hypothetical protein [Thermoanaerobaculia bacterium]